MEKELDSALSDLFHVMNLSNVKVEQNLELSASNLSHDIKRAIDEINSPQDIVDFWHIPIQVAQSIFLVLREVLFSENDNLSTEAELSTEEPQTDTNTETDADSESDSD